MRGGPREAWRLPLLAAGVCVVAALPTVALAAPRDFHIAAKPLSEALVDFAVQADVSINSSGARGCRRLGNAVSGRMEKTEALRRLLAGTGCGFEMIDARTVRIVRLPPAAPPTAPRPAPAIPEPPLIPTDVEEVIVTATRQPSVATRLPYAVSALSAIELERQGVDGANGVALLTPGLTVSNLGAGRDKLSIRGLSDGPLTGRVQSTVGIYLDDTRLSYSAPDPDLRLVDIERVEVLRGPQGSLYGAGSVGGIIHIVSRKPELGDFSASAAVEASFTADGGLGYTFEGMANVPLASDRAALRIVAYEELSSGYIDDITLGRSDINRTTRIGLRATTTFEISPDWSVGAGLVTQSISADDSQYVQAGLPDLTRSNRVAEPHHNDFGAAFLTIRGDNRYGRLRWTTTIVDHRLTSRYDASSALTDFGAPAGPAAAFSERFSAKTVLSELNLSAPLGARIPWLAGFFYSEGHEDRNANLRGPGLIYSEIRDDEVSEASIYGEASYPVGDWTLTLGGRYFWASIETDSAIEAPAIGDSRFIDTFSETGFAPKAVLRYQITDRWMAYVQAAEGYRTGGFNTGGPIGQVFGGPGSTIQPARRYRGDELWSYEAGSKWSNPDLGLSLQGAAFMVSWRDIQSTQLLPSGIAYTANIGDGRTVGLELEGTWSIGAFDFASAMLFTEPELGRPRPGFPAAPDSPLAGVPRLTISATAHYERDWGDGLLLTVDAGAAFVGPSRLTFDASLAPPMGNYLATRFAAGVESDRWRLNFFVENLADDRDNTFAYGNPFTLDGPDQITPQRPLRVGVKLQASF